MRALQKLALSLVIVGAINWGLIGFFYFDLVAAIFGGQETNLARIVYSLVGLSSLVCLPLLFKDWDDDEQNKDDMINSNSQKHRTEFGEDHMF